MTDHMAPGMYADDPLPEDRRILPAANRSTAFIGATASGPIEVPSGPLSSPADFTEIFGVDPSADLLPCIEGYFNNGGSELQVVRIDQTLENPVDSYRRAIDALAGVDPTLFAVPTLHEHLGPEEAIAVSQCLVETAEHSRAFALIDPPPGLSLADVRDYRGNFDSSYAALYYPWVHVPDLRARTTRLAAPSGLIAGVYAHTDRVSGVHKAPANATLNGVDGFEEEINLFQQELLNPLGVNCLRTVAGRGHRVLGARTLTSDPEWTYVSVRRYFNFIDRSIEAGTQWATFEPNGPPLWRRVKQTVEDFLYEEWRRGALLGSSPKEAFFVKCDRGTMTQNDLDRGRLVVLIGVAPLHPAEFVIFRIGQWTAVADHG